MIIETPQELAEQLADWFGIYGGCKSDGDNGCEFNEEKPFCCRQGFISEMIDRINRSVENQKVIELADKVCGLKT